MHVVAMLWACLYFPDFSLQLLQRSVPAESIGPLIVTTGGNRPLVLSCNAQARSHGIAPGMVVSAAIALAPHLAEHLRNAGAERQALERAAAWTGQFTSTVSLCHPDALLLELEGSLRLFGGVRSLLLRLSEGVAELGYAAGIAAAPTPTAARLLARAGQSISVMQASALPGALAAVPPALLDQPEETARMLDAIGVRTLAECLALPRDGLARRFGQGLLDELDRALGKLPDPREPYLAPARYKARLVLPAPVQETEPLLFAAKRLILEMAGFLRMKQAGVTRLKLSLEHEDRKPTTATLGFSAPSRDPQRIVRLLRERLSRLSLPGRVEALGIESEEARPLDSRNLSLFPEDRLHEEERWSIIDHLRARLGVDAVYGIATHADHRPESAWRTCEPGTPTPSDACGERPLWLLDQPRRLPTDHEEFPLLDGPLTLLAGPERIEGGWWDGHDVTRDYYIAADGQGRRLWIYRQREDEGGWFLQGMFA
jgi:protein ImuB